MYLLLYILLPYSVRIFPLERTSLFFFLHLHASFIFIFQLLRYVKIYTFLTLGQKCSTEKFLEIIIINKKRTNWQYVSCNWKMLPGYLKSYFIEGIAGLQWSTLEELARAPMDPVATVHGSGCRLRLVRRIGPTLTTLTRSSLLPLFSYLLRLTAQVVQPEEVHWHLCSEGRVYTIRELMNGTTRAYIHSFRANESFPSSLFSKRNWIFVPRMNADTIWVAFRVRPRL